jgi:hypothetical protein
MEDYNTTSVEINEYENYNIRLLKKYKPHQFLELVDRFIGISKIIQKANPFPGNPNTLISPASTVSNIDNLVNSLNVLDNNQSTKVTLNKNGTPRKKYTKLGFIRKPYRKHRTNLRVWIDTREKAIDVMMLHYNLKTPQKEQLAKLLNESYANMSKSYRNLKLRYDIKPEEIGLTKFPENKKGKRDLQRLPNFKPTVKTDYYKELVKKIQ